MEPNNKAALIVAFYFSKYNEQGLSALGFRNYSDAYNSISTLLGVKANSIRNMRDEFDPYQDNDRKGWNKREISSSRKQVLDKFKSFSFDEMTSLVQGLLNKSEVPIPLDDIYEVDDNMLKDLHELADECRRKYQEEFVMSDVALNEKFKLAYGAYLRKSNQSVDYNETTTIVTTNTSLKVLIPNQWFVMAAFMSEYVREILAYKYHLDQILSRMFASANEKKTYIGAVKDKMDSEQQHQFLDNAVKYFAGVLHQAEAEKCAHLLLAFISDYQWWYGSKTIDRGDFYVSPTLNLLGVVNNTQSYIADIAYYYATNTDLYALVPDLTKSNPVSRPVTFSLPQPATKNRKTGAENLIMYGAPGTGKSRTLEDRFGAAPFTIRVVFHPDYTYFDFVGSYKPVPVYKLCPDEYKNADGSAFKNGEPYITYKYTPGPFVEVLCAAWLDPENMYTLLIEEINRANAAAVFGEVFQLLDRTVEGESEYFIHPSAELGSFLRSIPGIEQYIAAGIKIPSNMNIVATMNSADQGVSIIDSAFKRRWDFEYLRIDIDNAVHKDAIIRYAGVDVRWGDLIRAVNEKLKKLQIDEDRLIGPYFIKPAEISKRSAIDKLLLYLWDDVLRHKRSQFFQNEARTFADISAGFQTVDVLNIMGSITTAEVILQDETDDIEN